MVVEGLAVNAVTSGERAGWRGEAVGGAGEAYHKEGTEVKGLKLKENHLSAWRILDTKHQPAVLSGTVF